MERRPQLCLDDHCFVSIRTRAPPLWRYYFASTLSIHRSLHAIDPLSKGEFR